MTQQWIISWLIVNTFMTSAIGNTISGTAISTGAERKPVIVEAEGG